MRFGRLIKHNKKELSSLNSTITAETMASSSLEEDIESYDYDEEDFDDEQSIYMDDGCFEGLRKGELKNSASTGLTSFGSLEFSDLRLEPCENEDERHDSCFHASYDLGKELGEGAFGSVWQCSLKSDASSSLAVKAVAADKYNEEEIAIMILLEDCPTIVKVEDVIHEFDQSYIVMPELEGGDLLSRISKKVVYTEAEARILCRALLETVLFCHERGVAHCDIKSENVFLCSEDDDTTMQLGDFGLAKRFLHSDGTRIPMLKMEGSAEYAAPEVFNRDEDDEEGYDERCDIWSCGVLLYLLLGGYPPFERDGPMETIKNVGRGKYKFHNKYWQEISLEAKVMIATMLQVNPDDRCTLEEALASPWLNDA